MRLIDECASCRIAVAWASVGFDAFDTLLANASKLARMVVGTHFYQTHPKFIEACLSNANVRFVLNPDGVFHPKVYLFEMAEGSWQCVLGSANFTQGGLANNDELAVLLTSDDIGASQALKAMKKTIDGYWNDARPVTKAGLQTYRAAWQRKRPRGGCSCARACHATAASR